MSVRKQQGDQGLPADPAVPARPGPADGIISDLRDVALRSGPALLLVLLGEFVLPRNEPVWSSTLMRALGELEIEPTAARKAIQRTAERGIISSVKEGRRVRCALTDEGRRLLEAGSRRVFEFTGASRDWDGRWLVLYATVPESDRNLRHHLRTRLTWCGLGSPTPGFWVTPHTDRAKDAAQIVEDLGLTDQSFSYIGHFGPVGDERRTAERAWDLEDLRTHYADFMDRFRSVRVHDDRGAFRSHVELGQAWRRFPYLDPALPTELAPNAWIGVEAARFFRRKRSSWSPRSLSHWDQLCAETSSK